MVYLQRLAKAASATYEARQLIVYLASPQAAAVLEIRSTPAGRFVRAERGGREVMKVWRGPGGGLVAGANLALEDASPASVPLDVGGVLGKYEVRVGPPSWLLGMPVVPLELVRKEDRRLVERLWLHAESGMVYRREWLDAGGRLLGMATTLEMRWGEAGQPEPYSGRRPSLVRAGRQGPAPAALPYGYRLLSAYRVSVGGRQADHWLYSDGLHALSVFRRPGVLRRPPGYRQVDLGGASGWAGPGPGTFTWQGGRWVWTVVAEEPQLDFAQLAAPFPKGRPPLLARLGSWWARAYHALRDRL